MNENEEGKLGRFGHHPDPAIDFCIEIDALEGGVFDAYHGISKPGTPAITFAQLKERLDKVLEFRVGGDQGCIEAKSRARMIYNAFLQFEWFWKKAK